MIQSCQMSHGKANGLSSRNLQLSFNRSPNMCLKAPIEQFSKDREHPHRWCARREQLSEFGRRIPPGALGTTDFGASGIDLLRTVDHDTSDREPSIVAPSQGGLHRATNTSRYFQITQDKIRLLWSISASDSGRRPSPAPG